MLIHAAVGDDGDGARWTKRSGLVEKAFARTAARFASLRGIDKRESDASSDARFFLTRVIVWTQAPVDIALRSAANWQTVPTGECSART